MRASTAVLSMWTLMTFSSLGWAARRLTNRGMTTTVVAPGVGDEVRTSRVRGSGASGAFDALDLLDEVSDVLAVALAVASSHGAQDDTIVAVPSRSWDSRRRGNGEGIPGARR